MDDLLNGVSSVEDLFAMWKNAHKHEKDYLETTYTNDEYPEWNIEQDSFNADGYIDKNLYEKSPIKVLFILKEANIAKPKYRDKSVNPAERTQYNFYRQYISKGDNLNSPKQQEKMGRMAFYLQHITSDERLKNPSDEEIKTALSKCAFMNLNKRGGDYKVTDKYYNYVSKYIDYILKEIELLNPTYIVEIGKTHLNLSELRYTSISHWHTAYQMPRIKRSSNPLYGDKNVDLYIRTFIKKCDETIYRNL